MPKLKKSSGTFSQISSPNGPMSCIQVTKYQAAYNPNESTPDSVNDFERF